MIPLSIINFNHIDSELDKDTRTELENLYKFYRKKYCLLKRTFKHLKQVNLICEITSSILIVSGTIAGAATLNPIVLSSITGSGVVLTAYTKMKNNYYPRKIKY